MPLDLSNTLVIGVSATSLYDMEESDRIFRDTKASDPDTAIEKYRDFMRDHEDEPLSPGTGWHLVKALLGLNKYRSDNSPLVEVVVMSRKQELYAKFGYTELARPEIFMEKFDPMVYS
jgi:5'-nucleotidase